MVERDVFLMKPKHEYNFSQSWKEKRLLCESVFVQINKRLLILKIVERNVCPLKVKLQYHLSQWGEYIYGV